MLLQIYKKVLCKKKFFFHILLLVIVTLPLFFFLEPMEITGTSMQPNYCEKEYVIINKLAYLKESPKRNDVVVFKNDKKPRKLFIKRVIAIAGDSVEVKEGKTYVNEKVSDQTYTRDGITNGRVFQTTISKGCVFCMGDNRFESHDSRDYGEISVANIIGAPIWKLY